MSESRNGPVDLRKLLDRHRARLLRWAEARLGRALRTKVDPADLVQEALLKALRDLPRFHGGTEAALRVWLGRILATTLATAVRRYRAQRRAVGRECPLPDEPTLIDPGRPAGDEAARREVAACLAVALAGLPADYRAVLWLRYDEGLTFPEIARRLRRTLDSVKKAWTRAVARLREKLDRAGHDPGPFRS